MPSASWRPSATCGASLICSLSTWQETQCHGTPATGKGNSLATRQQAGLFLMLRSVQPKDVFGIKPAAGSTFLSRASASFAGRANSHVVGVCAAQGMGSATLPNLPKNRCALHRYTRTFVLSHLPHMVYFDYQRVVPAEVTAAKEAHQVGSTSA